MTLPIVKQRPFQAPSTLCDYDIAIIGGGIVGLTLAVALKDSGLNIVIVEAQAKSVAIAKGQAYAIHLSSREIWQKAGIWDQIEPQIEPFTTVMMSDANYPHVVKFTPQDLKTDVVGYVAEHRVLLKVLYDTLADAENIRLMMPVKVDQLTVADESAVLNLHSAEKESPTTISARLVVGADGSNSQVRSQAGIQTRGWDYNQACLVATVLPELSHQNTAYERFWPSGPFAILPSNHKECRIVWTVSEQDAKSLLASDLPTFTQELQKRYGHQMGQIQVVSERYAFPAKIQQAKDYVRSRIALVGNAAHTCHPVGGQGLNLGIRDADALATVILKTYYRGEDIGNVQNLKPYQRQRKRQNFLSLGFTDVINRVFSNEFVIIQPMRRLGLRLMQWIPFVRINALKFMAGLLAL